MFSFMFPVYHQYDYDVYLAVWLWHGDLGRSIIYQFELVLIVRYRT